MHGTLELGVGFRQIADWQFGHHRPTQIQGLQPASILTELSISFKFPFVFNETMLEEGIWKDAYACSSCCDHAVGAQGEP